MVDADFLAACAVFVYGVVGFYAFAEKDVSAIDDHTYNHVLIKENATDVVGFFQRSCRAVASLVIALAIRKFFKILGSFQAQQFDLLFKGFTCEQFFGLLQSGNFLGIAFIIVLFYGGDV